jgi:hypothetical protein
MLRNHAHFKPFGVLEQQLDEQDRQARHDQDILHGLKMQLSERTQQIESERTSCRRDLETAQASLSTVSAARDATSYRARTAEEAAQIENRDNNTCQRLRYEAEHMQRVAEQAAAECLARLNADGRDK